MKTTLFACALVLLSVTCAAKPQIDASVYDSWPSVDGAQISEDGSYASYVGRAGSSPAKLVIVSTDARWRMELPAASAADFVCELRSACRFMVVRELQGALSVVQLGSSSVARLGAVETYKVSAQGGSPWLAYQPRSESQQLRLVNLNTQQERRFEKVVEYAFGTDGRSLLITTAAESQALQWLDLDTGKATTIWQGRGVSGAVFDDSGKRLAFVVNSADAGSAARSFWYYVAGTARARMVADGRSPTLSAGLRLNGIREFSKDGRHLLIDLQRNVPTLEPSADAVDVDVWSYRDERLQSQQLADLAAGRTDRNYAALLDLESRHIVQLEHNNELIRERAFNTRLGEVALLDRRSGSADRSEHHWSSAGKLSTELLLFRNGRRIPVSTWDAADESRPQLSPGGRFVVYFDPAKQVFLSLDTASGIVREISRGIDTNWQRVDAQWLPLSWSRLRGVAGWLQGDAAVLIYDRYDVWQIDLSGKAAPINVTNGYGNRTQTIFSLRSDVMPHERVFARNERLILPAFDRATKHSGFFTQRLGQVADPQRLSMGPYAYYLPTHERG
ncbi:hypothetical protein, partial [Steroidobacter sp.]|uniref:hypothetical protein n=1 Tax=Steroidobacter sp. TaxID=1978227 RepID=UPI001A4490DF